MVVVAVIVVVVLVVVCSSRESERLGTKCNCEKKKGKWDDTNDVSVRDAKPKIRSVYRVIRRFIWASDG